MEEDEFIARAGEPVRIEEFLGEMEERGLLIPRPPTTLERLKTLVVMPFKFVGRKIADLYWLAWGKRQYQKRLKKEVRRMKQLAGLDDAGGRQNWFGRPEKTGEIDRSYPSPSVAAAEHEHIIKTKIVREELPKPDFDDSGMN